MAANLSENPGIAFFQEGLYRQASTGILPPCAMQQSVDGANEGGKKAKTAYKDVVSHIAVLEALRQAEPVKTSRTKFHARLVGMGLTMGYKEYNRIAGSIVKLVLDYPKYFAKVDQFDALQFRAALDAFGGALDLDFGNTNALFAVSMQKVSSRLFLYNLMLSHILAFRYRLSSRLLRQQRRLPTRCGLKPKSSTKRRRRRRVANEFRKFWFVVFVYYLFVHGC